MEELDEHQGVPKVIVEGEKEAFQSLVSEKQKDSTEVGNEFNFQLYAEEKDILYKSKDI